MAAPAIGLRTYAPRRSVSVRPATLAWIGGGSLALAATFSRAGTFGFASAIVIAALGLALAWQLRRQPLWMAVTLVTVLGFVLFNRGFGYVGLSLGPAPLLIGEVTILVAIVAMPHKRSLGALSRDPVLLLLVLWFLYGCCVLALNAGQLTFDVAKDASVIYYPIFFYFGFATSLDERRRRLALRLLGLTFLLHLIYVFGFPWDVMLQELSPRVLFDLGLFGHYNTTYVHVIGGALFFAMLGPRVFRSWPRGAALAVSALYFGTLIFVQSRAGVLGALTAFAVLVMLGYRRRSFQLVAGLGAVGLIVAVAGAQGLALQGWKAPATLDFFTHMVTTSFGGGGTEYASAGLHATRESRFQMWHTAIEPNLASPGALLFGTGFGELLIDMELTTGWIKRSPHNSFVTIFARLGLVGLLLFAALHARFLRVMLRAARHSARAARHAERRELVWFVLYYVGFTFGALFSVVYDTPYMAAPAYFVMGLAYGTARAELASPVPARDRPGPSTTGVA